MEIYFDYKKFVSALIDVSSLKNSVSNIIQTCTFNPPDDFEGTGLLNSTVELIRDLELAVDNILGALMKSVGQLQSVGSISIDPMTLTNDLNRIINFTTLSDNSKISMLYILEHCDKNEMMNFIVSNINNENISADDKSKYDIYMSYFMSNDPLYFNSYIENKKHDLKKQLEFAEGEEKNAIEKEIQKYDNFINESGVADKLNNLSKNNVNVTSVVLPPEHGKVHTRTGWFDMDWIYGQENLIKTLGASNKTLGGNVRENELGFITYGQWYAGATTSTFGDVGDMLFVVQDDNSIFPVIIADQKSQEVVTWDLTPANEWGHNNGQCVVEFETGQTWDESIGNCAVVQPNFDHNISKIVNVGSVYETPEYVNNVMQALSDANLSTNKFIGIDFTNTDESNTN